MTSTRPQSSPTCSSWTRRRSSDYVSSADPDYDDATLEDMLQQVHRAKAFHSLREDLSVSLYSSSMSHRTGRPVEKRNQEAQIRTLPDKQREQILAECQARINYMNFKQPEPKKFNNEVNCKTEISRGPEHYIGTFWPNTGIAKWNKLYERFKGVSGCWINSQWTFPRYLSTCVFSASSNSWWNAKPFYRSAEQQRKAAKHLGHAWYIGKCFCKIQPRFLQHLIRKSRTDGSLMYQNTHHHMWWLKAKHQFRIRDASQDRQLEIQSSLVEQTNNDCRFLILIWQTSPRQQHWLVGRWGSRLRYVLVQNFQRKRCYGSKEVELVDSVDELRSSSSTRGISMLNFEVLDAKIASALNTIIHNTQFKGKVSLEEQQAQTGDRFLSWKTDRSPDLRVLPGHWSQRFCREFCRPFYYCSSKWWYSGIRFEMGRISIIFEKKTRMMTSWKDCTN